MHSIEQESDSCRFHSPLTQWYFLLLPLRKRAVIFHQEGTFKGDIENHFGTVTLWSLFLSDNTDIAPGIRALEAIFSGRGGLQVNIGTPFKGKSIKAYIENSYTPFTTFPKCFHLPQSRDNCENKEINIDMMLLTIDFLQLTFSLIPFSVLRS